MRIKAAMLDSNIEFMSRLSKIFQQKYPDKIALSMFTNEETLYQNLNKSHVDVVLFEQGTKINTEKIPDGVTVGYFSDIPEVEELEGFPAVCKYQRVEAIYKSIVGLCAEGSSNITLRKNDGGVKIVLFTSVQGGSGTSTAAAAYALRKAEEKRKVFYLNLEKFGNSGIYFSGEGKMSFSDVIFAVKSRKGNLRMKIESVTETDPSGVDFFHSCRNAYDMFEVTDEEVGILLTGISQTAKYEELVIDISGELTERMVMLMKEYADKIIYVADGSDTEISNGKFERFCEAARVLEQRQGCDILSKTRLLYNRYSAKFSVPVETSAVLVLGGLNRFQGAGGKELVREISRTGLIGAI